MIEDCRSTESEKRPTFDDIVYYLRSDPGFITDKINSDNFQKYISFIDDQIKEELCQRIQEDYPITSKKSNQQCKIESNSQNVNESYPQHLNEAEKGILVPQYFLIL